MTNKTITTTQTAPSAKADNASIWHDANHAEITSSDNSKVEEVAENSEAQKYLDHLLNDGCNEGDSGADMEMPPYYDEQLFKKGQTYMSKYRFALSSGMLSGLVAVLAIPSILRVLICTRQSSTAATAYRRYIRTLMHTKAWYDYAADIKNSKFWTSLKAVRDAHSRSSRASCKQGAGQITQKDLAITQFGFIGFLTLGAYRIDLNDDEFLEATSHMWRVVGYLLGIKDDYNICGENWAVTKLRLDIVLRKVFQPALENSDENFIKMTTALIEGLSAVNSTLTVGSFLFFTKRLACLKGYEYYEFDHYPGYKRDAAQKLHYYDMDWWDRFLVTYGLFIVTYLHKYNIIRWYLNFRVWLNDLLIYYLPYVAFWRYGIKWAYVSIFRKDGSENAFEMHLKAD